MKSNDISRSHVFGTAKQSGFQKDTIDISTI